MITVRVVAPHFVAGFVSDGCTVQRAAPILRYLVGRGYFAALNYIHSKGWEYAP